MEPRTKEQLKAEQRRLATERQIAELDAEIGALERTIDRYRTMHGLGKAPLVVTPEEAASYRGIASKEMLLRWADSHGGEIVMHDAARFLAAAGLFTDAPQAAGTLYPTIRRMEEFEKVGRGIYRRKERALREVTLADQTPDQPDIDLEGDLSEMSDAPF